MTRHEQVALGRHAGIDHEHVQARDELILRDVPERRFCQLRAVELAARLAANDRVTGPVRRTERRPAVYAFIEDHSDGTLVLWGVFYHRWFIDHARQVLWVTRREAIVFPALDVQQFVQGVAVRQPGRALLIRGEEIAETIES